MNAEDRLDELLRESFTQPPPQPDDRFGDAVMAAIDAQDSPKNARSPALILAGYWIVAAVLTVAVLASIGWSALETGWTLAVVLGAVACVAVPVVLLARLVDVQLSELLFQTIED
jgi:hypothetical protein